jgi:invasion protein IalB
MTLKRCLLMLVAVSLVAALGFFFLQGSELQAQAQQRGPAKSSPPPKAKGPAPSSPVHQRSDTFVYDSWRVTCQEMVSSRGKKACSAVLPLVVGKDQQARVLGAWILRSNEGALIALLQTHMLQVGNAPAGLLIAKGIELKLGNAAPRRISYLLCNAQGCEASATMDDAMVKEAMAASSAVITIYSSNGTALNINIPSIKGIDKAIKTVSSK